MLSVRFKTKIRLLAIALLGVTLALTGFGVYSTSAIQEVLDDRSTGIALRYQTQAEASLIGLSTQVVSLRDAQTGDRASANGRNRIRSETDENLSALRASLEKAKELEVSGEVHDLTDDYNNRLLALLQGIEVYLDAPTESASDTLIAEIAAIRQSGRDISRKLADVVKRDIASANRTIAVANSALIALAIAAFSFLGLFYYIGEFGTARPIERITAMLAQSSPEHDLDLPEADRPDEIGELAKGIVAFNQSERLRLSAEQKAARLTAEQFQERRAIEEERSQAAARSEAERRRSLEEVANLLRKTVSTISLRLNDTSKGIADTASTLAENSHSASGRCAQVETASKHSLTNAAVVHQATNELVASTEEISRNVCVSADKCEHVKNNVAAAVTTLEQLEKAVTTIQSMSTMITKVAQQTNMLALNATIEAGKLGSGDNGFSVVAAEIKALATSAAASAREINDNVNLVGNATGHAVRLVSDILPLIEGVNSQTTLIAAAVSQQVETTSDIARSNGDISEGFATVASGVELLVGALGNIDLDAGKMRDTSQFLESQAALLKTEVSGLIAELSRNAPLSTAAAV